MAITRVERTATRHVPWPLLIVAASIAFNLWTLRQELNPPQLINDTAIHASLSAWVEERVESGTFPLDGWFPPVSLGAPRLHHYQALPYLLTGSLQVLFRDAFPWTTYLLLAGWPAAVFLAARRFGLSSWEASIAAAVASVVRSYPGFGYESLSYTWFGPGLWPQLWAMWTLPLALAWSWRAISGEGSALWSVLLVGVTICLHLPTGYLALLLLAVIAFASLHDLGRRLWRTVVIGLGSLAVAAWQIVPALVDHRWTALDQVAEVRFRWDSFGAGEILGWLVSGQLFDVGRLPIVTLLTGFGVIAIVAAKGRAEGPRVIALIGLASLVLFFGRPTLGRLADLLPLGSSLSFRRFIVGVHLAGVFLAGIGGVSVGTTIRAWATRHERRIRAPLVTAAVTTLALGAAIVGYGSAVELRAFERRMMEQQRRVDGRVGQGFASLVAAARSDQAVRLYAGTNARPPSVYRIGRAPAYIALLNLGADVVGYRRPTWSFLSGVEARFDPGDRDQYVVFGVTHTILPGAAPPFPGAEQVASADDLTLWRVTDAEGYMAVGRSTGSIRVDRANLSARMGAYLASREPDTSSFPGIRFADLPTATPEQAGSGRAGSVLSSRVPFPGHHEGTVRMLTNGIVVLRASYDPGWRVDVDDEPATLRMVAPGFPAVVVGRGTHRVTFRYEPFDHYPLLLAIGILGISMVWTFDRGARRRGPTGGVSAGG